MDDQDSQTKPELRWLPLEGNPEVWNKIVHSHGVDKTWSYCDVYGFDPELLAMLPKPVGAIIFLFPLTENYENFKEEEEAHLTKLEQNVSPKIMFFKQTIANACGMIALLHSLANNEGIVGPGLFRDIIEESRDMSFDERAELLENNRELATIHERCALEGQTQAPGLNEDVDLHFITFVEADNHLYELDGRKLFPINHGKCTDLVEGAAKIMRQYMARDPDQTNFSAIALTKSDQ
ncbi:ubiquitin carboxyl-terminal hydrolase isozyme L3 [Syncephalastrum racemosum]|uniref:Ubiquitin carboxyl-terminal hydrolase n=1 Tax=Syncephalastrum racemosum TaxID=13706 RepID=A0A1X2HFC3_SYNRA|nr:ubiquitin carboxyl-terminal hydrolase isozyme L3 [Syncephalastrum racemosum]